MAVDPSAVQSDWVSKFRTDIGQVLSILSVLDSDRLKSAALGGVDNFVPEAFAGTNADLAPADIDAALTVLIALRVLLFDNTGAPTQALLTIAKVAR